MTKKIILIGALLAGLLTSQNAQAPVFNINYAPFSLENIINETPKYMENYVRKRRISAEEKELLKKDSIYNSINSVYEELNIPGYLTKKFVRSLIRTESSDNPRAVSNVGARGLGQLMQEAWYEVENENYWKNVFVPEENIKTTIKYLVWIDKECKNRHPNWGNVKDKEKIDLIAAAYNGGIGALKEKGWKIEKMKKETRQYVPKINKISKEFIPSAKIYESVF